MASYPTPSRPVALSAGDEALELRNVGQTPAAYVRELDEAFGYGTEGDSLSAEELDRLFEERMEAADRDSDPDPTRPGGAALLPDAETDDALAARFAAEVARWSDDLLPSGIHMADAGELTFASDRERQAWLAAACDAVLRRVAA